MLFLYRKKLKSIENSGVINYLPVVVALSHQGTASWIVEEQVLIYDDEGLVVL